MYLIVRFLLNLSKLFVLENINYYPLKTDLFIYNKIYSYKNFQYLAAKE